MITVRRRKIQSVVGLLVVAALLAEPLAGTVSASSPGPSTDPTTTVTPSTLPDDGEVPNAEDSSADSVRLELDGSRLAPIGGTMFVRFRVSNTSSLPGSITTPTVVRFETLPPGITLTSVFPSSADGTTGWSCARTVCQTKQLLSPLGALDGVAIFAVAADAAIGSVDASLLTQLIEGARSEVDKEALATAFESMNAVVAATEANIGGRAFTSTSTYKVTAVPAGTAVAAEVFALPPANHISGRTAQWTIVGANPGTAEVNGPIVSDIFTTSQLGEPKAEGTDWRCEAARCTYGMSLAGGALTSPLVLSGVVPEATDVALAAPVVWRPNATAGSRTQSIDLDYLPIAETPPNLVARLTPTGGVPLTSAGATASVDVGLATIGGPARDVTVTFETAGATFVSASGLSCTATDSGATCTVAEVAPEKAVSATARFKVRDDAGEGLVITMNAAAADEPTDKLTDNSTSTTLAVREKGSPIAALFPARRDGSDGWALDAVATEPITPTKPGTVAYVVKNVGSEPIPAGAALSVTVVLPQDISARPAGDWTCTDAVDVDVANRPTESILDAAANAAASIGADAQRVDAGEWRQFDCSLEVGAEVSPDGQTPPIIFGISAGTVAKPIAGAVAARLVTKIGDGGSQSSQAVEQVLVVDVPRIEIQSRVGDAAPTRMGSSTKATVRLENRGEASATPVLLAATNDAAGIEAVEGEGLSCVRIGGSLAVGIALCRASSSTPFDAGSEAKVSIKPQGSASEGAWSYNVVPLAVGRSIVVGGTTSGLVREAEPLRIEVSGPDMVSSRSFRSATDSMEPTVVTMYASHNGTTADWKQTSGAPRVSLTVDEKGNAQFIAPDVKVPTTLEFTVKATDGGFSASDSIAIRVEPVGAYRSPGVTAQSSTYSHGTTITPLPYRTDRDIYTSTAFRRSSTSAVFYRAVYKRSAPNGVDSTPSNPVEPWAAGGQPVRVRADSLGTGTISVAPGAAVTVVGASVEGVSWSWAVESGDSGVADDAEVVAATAGTTGATLRFTAPSTPGTVLLRATVSLGGVTASDLVAVKVGDASSITKIGFDVAGRTRPLVVASGGRKEVVATPPAGSSLTWGIAPSSPNVTVTPTASGARFSGTSPVRPLSTIAYAVARGADGRINGFGTFPLVIVPSSTFASLCDVTTAVSGGLLRSIPGVSGLDLAAEIAEATAGCARGTRLAFSDKSFSFAGFGVSNVSGVLDRNGLRFTGGTIDFPDAWPIDDVILNEATGSVISFRLIGGTRLGYPSVRLQGRLSARLSTALTAFGGWTWKPTISFENGSVRSVWLSGEGPTRADGTKSTILARGNPDASGSTTFEISATGVELFEGLRADISGTVGSGASPSLNVRGSVVGSWTPFDGATMSNISLRLATGQPTTVSGTLALSVSGLAAVSVSATVSVTSSDRWALTVDAGQTRDLTLVEGVVLRGASVSGSLTRNVGATSGSLRFEIASLPINAFAEVSNLRADARVDCPANQACSTAVSVSSSLILRTATPTTVSLAGTVDTAARLLSLTGTVASVSLGGGITLSSASFTYANRAGTVTMTASARARLLGTDTSVSVAFNPDSTVVSGGINNLRLFGATGPTLDAEVAFAVNTAAEVSWSPTTANLRALNLPAVALPINGIHLTASMATPTAFRTFLGASVPERFVLRANVVGGNYTLLGREFGGQIGGTLTSVANGWRWDATINLTGDFEFFTGARFRAPSIRVRGGGGTELTFGLSGSLVLNLTGSEFVVPFDLPSLDATNWSINLQTPAGGAFSVEPIRGLRLGTLGGSISRRNSEVTIAISFAQAAGESWQPFAGFSVTEASVSASATCPNLEDLDRCTTTLSLRGRLAVPGLGSPIDVSARRDAAGWAFTAAAGTINVAPGVRITGANVVLTIPNAGNVTATASGTFNVLGVDLAASVTYNQQGTLVTAGIRGTWEPIPRGPSFSDASVAFATYAIPNFDPAGAPAPQNLAANDPTFFGSVNLPQSITRALGLEGIRIDPVGISLGNISSGNFGFNIAVNTGGPKWIVNFGGKGLKLTGFGIRIAMRNFVPTFGLYGEGQLVVPSQPSGVPLVLDLTITATGGLSVAATLGIDANGRENPWRDAFGVQGLVVRALAISFSLQPPNPFPGFGAGLSIELPASIRDVLGMSEGVVLTAVLNVQVDSMCLSVSARGQRASDKVIDILDGVLTATQFEMTFAPLGCNVGRIVVPPGIRASFSGSVLGVPVTVNANVDPAQLSVEASVAIGAFNVGPLRLDETVFEMGAYGRRPLDSFVRFSGGLSLGSTRVRASVDVRNDGFDISGSIDNLSLVPGLVEIKQARLSAGFDVSDTRLNLNVLGSVEVLRQALNVNLDVEVDRSGVRNLRGSVEAELGLGEFLRISGRFGFDMSISNPSISIRGQVVAAGYSLLEVEGSINRNALSVSARTDMFGIFQGSVTGKVVWCNAGNTETITNIAGQQIVAQSGDFFFATSLNVNMDFAGFNAQGGLKLGYSAPSGRSPQRQACGGNGQRAVGTPSTTTSSTTTSSTTTTVPLVNRLPNNNGPAIGPGAVSTVPRATTPSYLIPTTSTVAITVPGGTPNFTGAPRLGLTTTTQARATTTTARPTTTLAPSPPVAREFFGEISASFELGGSGFGGRVSISGMFSTGGDLSLRGAVNLDLTVATARASVEFTRTRGGSVRFAISTTVTLAGSQVSLSGSFERSGRRTSFDLSGSANVNLFIATVNVGFRVNNSGVVATANLRAGDRSWAYFSASLTIAFTRDGWLIDVGGELVLASGLVEIRGRLAIGNLSCNARMECRSVRTFATIEASFPIGPIQFSLNASVLNGFSMTIAGAWEHTTGRIDLGNCWGRGYAGVTASLAIRSNPSRGQARIELTGTAAVKGRIWGDWCWAGTPDNESDRWRWSLSASVRVTLDPWSLTVTVDFGIPGSITIGPIAGVRVRIE
jgi:hypothetical protein